jgi:hypothetical protein
MWKLLSLLSALAAVAMAAGAYFASELESPTGSEPLTGLATASPEPAFVVEPTERDLGEVPLDVEQTVTFRVTNPASRARRIVGKAEG